MATGKFLIMSIEAFRTDINVFISDIMCFLRQIDR